MRYALLGPLEVLDDGGRPVDLGGRQPRVVVAMLLAAGRVVTADAILQALWGDEPPATATGTLQSYVSRLRRRSGVPVVWEDPGYRIDVAPDDVDFRRFEALADRGRALLDAGDPAAARTVLDDAADLWRGPALGEFADLEFATGLAVRLEERRLAAVEDRLTADLALGHHGAVVGELTALVAQHPLRERLQELLALALYRAGRQAEALRVLADGARLLRDELGIEPSRPLRELEAAILAHDRSLEAPASPRPAAAAPPPPAPATPAPPAAGAGAGASTLVGRDTELAALVAALDESAVDARFVVVEGEPGIGKTRLVEELRAVAAGRGALAVWGRADESGAAPALWPWLPPLRAVARAAGAGGDALDDLLHGQAAAPHGGPPATRFERFEAVAALVGDVAAGVPVVVLLDDLQWADDSSLELLAFLSGRLERGVLVVGTVRQLEVGRNDAVTDALAAIARRPGSRRIPLRGLDRNATAAVLEASTGAVSAQVAAAIHSRAEGNPFYAIELARLRQEGGSGEVPGSVGDVIRRRLGHLPQPTVDVLGVAAVVGRDVELGLLARAAHLSPTACADAVDPALVHRLLVDVPDQPSIVRFSHALVREVLLDDLSPLRRARLHLEVADAMEAAGAGVDDAEILAEHLFRAAAVGGGRRAAEALERAAEVAVRRVSYGAAEDLLSRAVQLRRATAAGVEDQEAELVAITRLVEVARARRYFAGIGGLPAIERGKELAERLGRHDTLFNLLWVECASYATSCRIEESIPLTESLRDIGMASDDPLDQARALTLWAVLLWQLGRVAEALEHLERGHELFASFAGRPAFDLTTEHRMLNETFLLFMRAATGATSPDESFEAFDRLVAQVPDGFAASSVLGFASTTAMALGRWDALERFVRRGRAADPGLQFDFWSGMQRILEGVVLAWQGRADEALDAVEDGRARYTGTGGRSGLAADDASLALHLARHGRQADAEAAATRARAELEANGERWTEPVVLVGEAAVAAARGEREAAAGLLERAVAVAAGQGAGALARRAEEAAAELGLAP